MGALRHRPDLKQVASIPSHITLAPHLYFDMGELDLKFVKNEMVNIAFLHQVTILTSSEASSFLIGEHAPEP
jgi:2'-5' RNA ligase